MKEYLTAGSIKTLAIAVQPHKVQKKLNKHYINIIRITTAVTDKALKKNLNLLKLVMRF